MKTISEKIETIRVAFKNIRKALGLSPNSSANLITEKIDLTHKKLVDNLNNKGITSIEDESIQELSEKVNDIDAEWFINDCSYMFYGDDMVKMYKTLFKRIKAPINAYGMFCDIVSDVLSSYQSGFCTELENLDMSQCTDMSYIFSNAYPIISNRQLDLSKWNTKNVEKFKYAFNQFATKSSSYAKLVVPFNTSKATDMSYMFGGNSILTALDISTFDFSNVTTLYQFLTSCQKLSELKLPETLNFENCTTMYSMFAYCYALTKVDFSKATTSKKLTDMGQMFRGCTALEEVDLSGFYPYGVTTLSYAFQGCSKLKKIIFPKTFYAIYNLSYAFKDCTSLEEIDLTDLISTRTTNVLSNISYMFSGCTNLKTIRMPKNCRTTSNITTTNAFENCTNLTAIIWEQKTPIKSSNKMFAGSPVESGTCYIYVPDASVSAYKSSSLFSAYADQIKPISEYSE
jgi:surface protein